MFWSGIKLVGSDLQLVQVRRCWPWG